MQKSQITVLAHGAAEVPATKVAQALGKGYQFAGNVSVRSHIRNGRLDPTVPLIVNEGAHAIFIGLSGERGLDPVIARRERSLVRRSDCPCIVWTPYLNARTMEYLERIRVRPRLCLVVTPDRSRCPRVPSWTEVVRSDMGGTDAYRIAVKVYAAAHECCRSRTPDWARTFTPF